MDENKKDAELNDHDVLIENTVLLKELIRHFENHIRHHWAITLLALSVGFIGTVNLCIELFLILAKRF